MDLQVRLNSEKEDEPPLLNDTVLPYMTPSHFLEWMRWKLETPTWVLQTYEAIVLDRAQRDCPENRPYYLNMIARVSDYQRGICGVFLQLIVCCSLQTTLIGSS